MKGYFTLYVIYHLQYGDRGGTVVKVLFYKSGKAAGSIPADVLPIALRPWGRLSL